MDMSYPNFFKSGATVMKSRTSGKTFFLWCISFGWLAFGVTGCTGFRSGADTAQTTEDWGLVSAQPVPESRQDTTVQSGSFTDPRDGEIYPVITIGDQLWMAENLRFNAPGSWLNPDNPSAVYGRLYDARTAQTACPDGWHLPSDAEWNELEIYLGMSPAYSFTSDWRGTHAPKLKSTTGWGTSWTDHANGTNSSGFNAFPAGYCDPDNGVAVFEGLGHSVGFWSSVEFGQEVSWQRWLGAPLEGVNRQADDLST
ncbi:MAG: hypothetical protein KDC54_19405, partial [Lewinella sp.]|nr:hypothetical protein [Lewinella sp.]